MSSELKQTLKSLCCSHGWSYGIFWRFDHVNSMLLTMEDAYYEEHIAQILNDMLLQVHVLGEGIIGEAALTGKYRWLFSDEAQDMIQDKHEFHNQFCSGVKTIAIVPVGSRGVVQLGSSQKILESLEFLDETKRQLVLGKTPSCLDTETYDLDSLFASLVPLENNSNPANLEAVCDLSFDEIMANPSSSTSSTFSSFISEVCKPSFQAACTEVQDNGQSSVPEASYNLDSVPEDFKEDDSGMDILNSYSLDDLYQLLAQSPEQSTNHPLIDDHQEWAQLCSISPSVPDCDDLFGPVEIRPEAGLTCFSDDQEKSMIIQSGDNDLFNVLGLNFGHQTRSETTSLPAVTCVSESKTEFDKPSTDCARKGLFSELGIEELISSVGNYSSPVINPGFQINFNPTKRRKIESSSSSFSHIGTQNLSFSTASMDLMQPLFDSWSKINNNNSFKKAGLWIDDSHSINLGNTKTGQSKKPEEPAKVNKKRAKPGESTRPRPKDRQAIQDRLKELRGLVPSGTKCSIDALLDLTIRYVLLLQNVSKYADKLKQSYKPKLINQQNASPFTERVGDGNGATWAFEVVDQTTVCPIIVEDLNPPGQMLIEMLCDERGQFLEIADMIKGLGLSILKGVMETQEGKIWAHFIVEAKRHVTRLDVFWSLVQLLHQSDTNINSIDSKSQEDSVTNSGISLSSLPANLSETLQ